jgi:hypothetical protein
MLELGELADQINKMVLMVEIHLQPMPMGQLQPMVVHLVIIMHPVVVLVAVDHFQGQSPAKLPLLVVMVELVIMTKAAAAVELPETPGMEVMVVMDQMVVIMVALVVLVIRVEQVPVVLAGMMLQEEMAFFGAAAAEQPVTMAAAVETAATVAW